MVSAAEALRSAIHEGVLEEKKRTGGWKKKHFILTPTHWMYFDAIESSEPKVAPLATIEILKVQPHELDATQRGFFMVLYKKKKEYRAAHTEDRDAWIQALESVAALTKTQTQGSSNGDESSRVSTDDKDAAKDAVLGPNGMDLTKLCDQMKKSFSWQLQISKSFTAKDVIEFIKKQIPDIAQDHVLRIGQELIDGKLIVPLKSHVFDEHDTGRFRFYEVAAQRQPRNHLAMRAQSISDLMGNANFSPRKYAEDFLKKHSSEKIDVHCKKLIVQKARSEQTIEELKEEISANYTSFIQASAEIKRMENSVSQLKSLVLDCKRSIQSLQGVSLDLSTEPPGYELAEKQLQERSRSKALDGFIHDLEVYLHERNYDQFARLILELKQKQTTQHGDSVSEQQQTKIDQLLQQFIGRLVEDFNSSMQTSERMHKKEDHLKFLIQLGEANLATEMCLQNYSVRIALQLRHVPSYGNALSYVINLSRTFFTSLLVCYEDYEQSFRGQESVHFISLTVWISSQLERFANEIICHIFPNDLRDHSSSSSANCVAIDVAEFKNVAEYVSSALRYVFYGSRQLELAGLPTAHCLAPHLIKGLVSFLSNYGGSIKATMREEIKRERWEMVKRTIRDTENKHDCEIILTQSARSFYSMVQQFLRDIQRVLNPSCATSYLPEVHDAVVLEADELLIRYTIEVKKYLDNPKMSGSLRLKQIVGILTNVACIHDDCAARSTHILQEYLPKAALQNREVDPENAQLWREVVAVGIQCCAQSILKMSIRWQDMDLSEEQLPDVGSVTANITNSTSGSNKKEASTLFVATLMKDLDGVSNDRLEKGLRKYLRREGKQNSEQDEDYDRGEDQVLFATMVLEAMLQEVLDDDAWWQLLKKGGKDRRIGCGGVNKFIAELQVLSQSVQGSKRIGELCDTLTKNITDVYRQFRPEKKDILANKEWMQGYIAICTLPST
ncbi:Exocyst complex component 8, partial [Globisporangium splendens]